LLVVRHVSLFGAITMIWLVLDSRGLGGIETHVFELAVALREQGHPVHVVFMRYYGGMHPIDARLRAYDIPVLYLDGSLGDAIARHKPDIIHAHGYKASILARIHGRIHGVPVATTFHAGEPGRGRMRLYGWVDRLTAPLGEIIAVSNPIAQRLGRRARVIPNFVRIPPHVVPTGNKSVFYVGRFSHEKGVDRLLDLARDHPNLKFEVFGEGPMEKEIALGKPYNVILHGATADMEPHWKRAGLCIMPSRHEGLPMVALEAQSRGIPVAAFDVGDLGRVIRNGDNGWLIEPENVRAFSVAIGEWASMDCDCRSKMHLNARNWIVEQFSPQRLIPELLAVYRQAGAAL
jgi:hypothetical protein